MALFVVIILFILIYFYIVRNYNYWARRNVKHSTPIPLFGNHFKNILSMKNRTEISEEYYRKYPNERVVGYFKGSTPELIVRDPGIAKRILVTDFHHFYRRGLGRDDNVEMVMANIFNVDGDTWKLLRQRLTPAFTAAKLRSLFPYIRQCAKKLQGVAEEIAIQGSNCSAHDLMSRYTIEVIATCGFGIEVNAVNNVNSLYKRFGKIMFSETRREVILSAVWELFPVIRKYLPINNPKVDEVMLALATSICRQRNHQPIGKNDFVDILLELKNLGTINGDSMENKKADGTPEKAHLEIDVKCMAAQLYIFFAASFQASSTAMTSTLYYLASNQRIQQKIQKQIDEMLLKNDNILSYDVIAKLHHLDNAFKEALRIFPPGGVLHRVCCTHYEIPELNITLDPGVKILIPVKAMQNDAKYFDNPEEFRPERFESKNEETQSKYVYMPFGDGPRNCIGARLGRLQSLAGLATVLSKFTVVPTSSTPPVLKADSAKNTVQTIEGGVPLKLKRRLNYFNNLY